jgi:hypothetical protein
MSKLDLREEKKKFQILDSKKNSLIGNLKRLSSLVENPVIEESIEKRLTP